MKQITSLSSMRKRSAIICLVMLLSTSKENTEKKKAKR